MAPPKRTLFVMLVSITGVFYFLYMAYTFSLDSHLYKITCSKALVNFSCSTSSLQSKKKEQSSYIYAALKSISNNRSNNSEIKAVEKKEGSSANTVPLIRSTKDNPTQPQEPNRPQQPSAPPPPPPQKAESQPTPPPTKPVAVKSSVIQRIPSKTVNNSIDVIVQGVPTRSVYDSGFRVPNVELCPDLGKDLEIVIIITSAPKHAEARSAIRQTWGHYHMRTDITIAFILGRSDNVTEKGIMEEYNLYKDIIVGNFYDSYNNLTLKTLSILEWVDNYCTQVGFLLKTDDDMFINVPKLLSFTQKHKEDRKKIFGKLARKWKPIRKKTSKYYVSVQQFNKPFFPDFTTGPAYLITSDVIHELYLAALDMTYLKLEDVFTTGILAQERNVSRVHVPEFLNRRLSITSCNVQKVISLHMIKPIEQYDLWKRLFDGRKC